MLRVLSFGILVSLVACDGEPTDPGADPGNPGVALTGEAVAASGVWLARADYPNTLWNAASASFTDSSTHLTTVYVIGGNIRSLDGASGSIVSAVKAYNVTTNTWTAKAPVPVRVMASNGAVEINGKIYLSGGYSRQREANGVWGSMRLQSLYVYDIATNTWTRKADMPFATDFGVSAGYRGRLYVATPCYDESCMDHEDGGALWRYDPGTDHWVLLGSTPHIPRLAGGGIIGGKFYLVATFGADVYVDIYDVATGTWSTGPRPPYICAPASTTLGAKIYLVGCGDSPDDNHVQVYDPKTASWSQAAAPTSSTTGSFRTLSRVFVNGVPGLELIGGTRPGNHWRFVP